MNSVSPDHVGYTLEEVRQALMELNARFRSHNHDGSSSRRFDTLVVDNLSVSNIVAGRTITESAGSTSFKGTGIADFFVPVRLFAFDYATGTTGGPESSSAYSKEGFIYARINYDAGATKDIRVYIGGAWHSVNVT